MAFLSKKELADLNHLAESNDVYAQGIMDARADIAANKAAAAIPLADAGNKFVASNVEAALAEVKTIADAGVGGVKRTLAVGFADFAALGAADFVSLNVGAVLPANARLLGYEIAGVVAFDDGGASVDVKATIGVDGETVSNIMGSFDIDTAAAGAVGGAAPGAKGHPMVDLSGKQVTVTITTDNAAHLAGLDSGAMTVNVFYIVLA